MASLNMFVSIASYCDPMLKQTLESMYDNADAPDHIIAGVVNQTYEPENRGWVTSKRIRALNVNAADSLGACWARAAAQTLYRGETFYLQIDSHTIFDAHWDTTLVNMLNRARAKFANPLISAYPMQFDMMDGVAVPTRVDGDLVTHFRPKPNQSLTSTDCSLNFQADYVVTKEDFLEGAHVAAGFIFTSGDFVQNIPYDAQLYFTGEEQSIAARAFTTGYTILQPQQRMVPLYHLYKEIDQPHATHHWHDVHQSRRSIHWHQLTERSNERLCDLLYRRRGLGVYGLGGHRDFREFQMISRVDYANKKILETSSV